jgi:N-acetylmuramoyl-L-alanine amidase
MVAVPLSAKQTNIGLLEAFSTEPYGFNDSDVRSLSLLAELILAALRPEEEDRLAEISRRVVTPAAVTKSALAQPEQDLPEVEHSVPVAQPKDPKPAVAAGAVEEVEVILPLASVQEYGTATSSRTGLAVVVAMVVIAVALGTGLWWSIRRHEFPVASAPQKVAPAPVNPAPQPQSLATTATTVAPIAEPAEADQEAGVQEASSAAVSGQRPEVTGLRHWSSGESSTVVIDLQDQVQYEAHRLSHPERIYVDLPDTRLVAALFNKTIDMGDALLQRVRVAQPTPGVTRVVLETKGASNFSVSLEPNPYRLVIEVKAIGSEPKPRAKVELFGPMDQPQSQLLAQNANTGASRPALRTGEPKLRIVLDAGHGGWDLGTVGRKGLLEKDLVLDIVERVGKLVEQRLAASVIYTRTDDNYVALERRTEVANLAKANLFLSIHANYSDFPSARGVETYYTNTYSSIRARTRENDDAGTTPPAVDWTNVDIREKVHESRRLAASIQRALYGTLSTTNPGLPNRGVKRAQYAVLTGTSMPAVLAEVSFVSSPTDENNLQSSSYRQRIAEALYQGVARYAEGSRVKMASVEKPAGQ